LVDAGGVWSTGGVSCGSQLVHAGCEPNDGKMKRLRGGKIRFYNYDDSKGAQEFEHTNDGSKKSNK